MGFASSGSWDGAKEAEIPSRLAPESKTFPQTQHKAKALKAQGYSADSQGSQALHPSNQGRISPSAHLSSISVWFRAPGPEHSPPRVLGQMQDCPGHALPNACHWAWQRSCCLNLLTHHFLTCTLPPAPAPSKFKPHCGKK